MVLDGKKLAPKIKGAHAILATLTRQPIYNLADSEAEVMGVAIADVLNLYGFEANPGMVAWLNLLTTCGVIYGQRLYILNVEAKARRAAQTEGQTTFDFGGMQ